MSRQGNQMPLNFNSFTKIAEEDSDEENDPTSIKNIKKIKREEKKKGKAFVVHSTNKPKNQRSMKRRIIGSLKSQITCHMANPKILNKTIKSLSPNRGLVRK